MKDAKRTYYKAFFLLLVFGLNTVVGFACSSSGLFHSLHHSAPAGAENTGHEHGKSHGAEKSGAHGGTHQSPGQEDGARKEDCCSGSVVSIQAAEKAASRIIEAPGAVFQTSLFAYAPLFSFFKAEKTPLPLFVRWRLPATIQDLRIVIQSFQI